MSWVYEMGLFWNEECHNLLCQWVQSDVLPCAKEEEWSTVPSCCHSAVYCLLPKSVLSNTVSPPGRAKWRHLSHWDALYWIMQILVLLIGTCFYEQPKCTWIINTVSSTVQTTVPYQLVWRKLSQPKWALTSFSFVVGAAKNDFPIKASD